MEGDENSYSVSGFDPTIMLPDEAVYKPKKKNKVDRPEGLENFMDKDNEDSNNNWYALWCEKRSVSSTHLRANETLR